MRALAIVVLGFVGCHAPSTSNVIRTGEEPKSQAPTPPMEPEKSEEVAVEAPDTSFPKDEIESYFVSGQAEVAMRLFRRQQYPQAIAIITQALDQASGDNKRPLKILLAAAKRESGDNADAGRLFAEAVPENKKIADYLNFEAAQAYAAAGDPKATVHAEKVDPTGPWGGEIEFLLAGAARAKKQHSQAVKHYRAYIEKAGASELVPEARYHLGAELAELGQEDEKNVVWRKLVLSAPVSSWAALVGKGPLTAKLSGPEYIERGMGYFVAMRNLPSEADFAAALRKSDLSKEERCQAHFHRAKSVYKERKYGRSAPLFELAIRACKKSGNSNYEVKSAYQAGLAFSRSGDHRKSIEHYAYIAKYPEHSYADDAQLRQAEEYTSLKEFPKVRELLSTLPDKYPEGDMRGEALWRLARRAYQLGNYETAVTWLEKQIATVPIEEKWWAEGQAYYWLGRSLAHLKQNEKAAKAYEDCVDKHPLTYYSMQALNRLREDWPERYKAKVAALILVKPTWSGALQNRPEYATPAFESGLELARLGQAAAAKREFAAIGFAVPTGRTAVRSSEEIDKLVATQYLLDLAGDYEGSHWIARWHTIDYRRSWPTGASKDRWRLAYPLAFWKLLSEFADKYNYPAHLQMAIVREESAFDPSRESYANAIGLTQMIFPTARDHSVGSGIAVTRENLMHPVKNVTIGSHFLESLQKAFEGRVGLMVPGYNAGRARVRGWIRTRHHYDLDEFIERIKGDQARRYTKRVLGSFFTYRYLDEGTIPVVRNAVPKRLSKL